MRLTKRIIIRVIVAVAVAFILSKLRIFGLMQVSAKEVSYSDIYNYVSYTSTSGYGVEYNNINTKTIFNKPFQGVNLPSNRYKAISFLALFPNYKDSIGNIEFVAHSETFSSIGLNGLKSFAINDKDAVVNCEITQGSQYYYYNQYNTYYSYFNGLDGIINITCPNAYIGSNGYIRIFITGNFNGLDESARPLYLYISKVSFFYDDTSSSINDLVEQQKETNDFIKNDNVDSASSKAEAFFEDFDSSDFGLKDVVLAPVSFIESLLDYQCQPLRFPLPFVNEDVVLPCMSTIYSQYPTFYSLWQMITTGMICYYVCLNIFAKVKQLTDPLNDRIEVIEL